LKEKAMTVCGHEWAGDCENYVNHVDMEAPSMWNQQSWSVVVAFRTHGQVGQQLIDPIELGTRILSGSFEPERDSVSFILGIKLSFYIFIDKFTPQIT